MIQSKSDVMADECSTNNLRAHGGRFGDGGVLMVVRGGSWADG